MKRVLSICLVLSMFMFSTMQSFAASPSQKTIDLGFEDFGDGVLCHSILIIEDAYTRASNKNGSIIREYTWLGQWIGSVQLNGSFTYNGRTATATSVSVYNSTASGWGFMGENQLGVSERV